MKEQRKQSEDKIIDATDFDAMEQAPEREQGVKLRKRFACHVANIILPDAWYPKETEAQRLARVVDGLESRENMLIQKALDQERKEICEALEEDLQDEEYIARKAGNSHRPRIRQENEFINRAVRRIKERTK